ncbi:MAG: tetratricopeptide repeat protein [Planctomycetota bacterium]
MSKLALIVTLIVTSFAWSQDEALDVALIEEMVLAGDYADAEETFEDAVAAGEALDRDLALWRVRLLRETGRGAEGISFLRARPEFVAGDAQLITFAGRLLEESGAQKEAQALFERALESDPKNVEARSRLGQLLIEQGQRAKGMSHLRAVIETYKKMSRAEARATHPETFVWMGDACIGLNRYQDAYKVMYESALDLDPECAAAHVASGEIMISKYNYPDARSHFKDALKTNRNLTEAHVGLADATIRDFGYPGNRFASALSAVEAADRSWKDHPRALLLRGYFAFYDEHWEEAERLYRAAIARDPSDLYAQAQLAAVLYCVPKLDEFEALKEQVLRDHPAPAPFFAWLADRLVDRFFYKEGVEFARQAIAIDPDYWPAYVIRGINALRIGNEEEGRKWSKQAFDKDPFNVWANNTLVLVRHMDKKFMEKKTRDFVFRLREEDEPYMLPYLEPLMVQAKLRMERDYGVDVHEPITIEAFSAHRYFSARSIGLPGLAASGVCFGRMVTLTTPRALPGNWGAVAVHEFMHVVSLAKSEHRVPRWFTEGLSVFEEGRKNPRWTRYYSTEWVEAVHHGRLRKMADIQGAFTKPNYGGEILLAYFQGGMICRYLEKKYGFDKIPEMLNAYRSGLSTEKVFQKVLGLSLDKFDEEFIADARQGARELGLYPRYLPDQIDDLRFHVEDNPKDIDGLVKLGLAYLFSQRLADVELTVGKALKLDKPHKDLPALIGMLKLQQGKTKGARTSLRAALDGGTNYKYRCTLGLAVLLAGERETEAAIEMLKAAIATHPAGTEARFGAPNPYKMLADLLNKNGGEAEAVAVLEDSMAYARDDLDVRKRLASHYRGIGDWPALVAALEDGPYIDPFDMEVHQLLAEGYNETGRWAPALREYTILTKPDDAPLERIYPEIAWCHFKLGESELAREFAEKALKMAPGNARAQAVLDGLER